MSMPKKKIVDFRCKLYPVPSSIKRQIYTLNHSWFYMCGTDWPTVYFQKEVFYVTCCSKVYGRMRVKKYLSLFMCFIARSLFFIRQRLPCMSMNKNHGISWIDTAIDLQ